MPPPAIDQSGIRLRQPAFTLVELLVSMAVLALLTALVAQLFSRALDVTTTGNKRIESDEQARTLFDRMAVDFARMVKRADVDYFLKQSPANKQPGDDQIAFYSEVPGYFSAGSAATTTQSPISLVAYRVNANPQAGNYRKVERLGKGLVWNGASATDAPVLFLPVPLASPLPSPAPTPAWPQAGSSTMADPQGNYELIGPQVFRLEYYYLLKAQPAGGANTLSVLSDTPWDTRSGVNHTAVSGLQDVVAIVVTIAVIDPKSQVLVTSDQLATLAGHLEDFTTASAPGTLEARWQATLDAGVPGFPQGAAKWVRIYHRYFYLNSSP